MNAGDGTHQHPTQALLDLYAMRRALGRLEGLHVAIVGDVLHSRVAHARSSRRWRSSAPASRSWGRRRSSRAGSRPGCEDVAHDIGAIADADVVYVLRMQRERMLEGANYVPSLREYTARWGVTAARLRPR